MREIHAAFFNIGDLIKFGKYKNKVGKIVAFGDDGKGNPTVTIEPVPKGRKQNKTMTLFKIWKMPIVDKVANSVWRRVMNPIIVENLVNRVLKIAYPHILSRGKTLEHEKNMVRIHRFAGNLRVWDLTNAGKKGKVVKTFSWGFMGEVPDGAAQGLNEAAVAGYEKALAYAEKAKAEFGGAVSEYEEKGVTVKPMGFNDIKLTTKYVIIEADYDSFSIKDRTDDYNEPTCVAEGKRSVGVFYRWFTDNLGQISKMKYRDILVAMKKAGVEYHDYCSID